jgi:tRNA pseudouridine13 synthase
VSIDLPFLTGDVPALAFRHKVRWEDFVVTEVPALAPAGRGDHTWLEIEKRGLATSRAVSDLAAALGVKPSAVGVAGLKDARSVARQWVSVEHVAPDRALSLSIPRIRVLRAERHPRKLRRGWHAGNRFAIRLRPPAAGGFPADAVARAGAVLSELARRGVPNYYGPQRFGYRGDTWRVGRALARGEWAEAASLIAGRPSPGEGADLARARSLFDGGRYEESAAAWPRGFGQCARLAAAMARTDGDAAGSLAVVGKPMLRLYASAYQAWLFNRVLARRIGGLDRLEAGDLAWKHDTESLFLVAHPAAEQPRADAFEVSPTGPLVGRRMREPAGDVAALEAAVLREAGFDDAELDSPALRPLTGRRRPLRFPLAEVAVADGADDLGPYLELRFRLPPGCYATAVLREIGGD